MKKQVAFSSMFEVWSGIWLREQCTTTTISTQKHFLVANIRSAHDPIVLAVRSSCGSSVGVAKCTELVSSVISCTPSTHYVNKIRCSALIKKSKQQCMLAITIWSFLYSTRLCISKLMFFHRYHNTTGKPYPLYCLCFQSRDDCIHVV